jgi:hypothetical protein
MRGERGETDWFIYLFICGDPKMGYNRCPLFIILTKQGFCVVSFIKIDKTEFLKLILSKLDQSETLSLRLFPFTRNNDQNLVILRSQSGDPLTSNFDYINLEFWRPPLSKTKKLYL